jgi:glycosyltransferase involved in cell wall biosynthesis
MSKMKSVSFYAAFNERTGYGVHASRMAESLEKLLPVHRNQPGGDISLTLIDVVSIQNIKERLPYPSICYSVWESTEYPSWFIDRLKFFDQLWVPSEWQRAASIAQGIPEEFVKVVPEGVDPEVYKPKDWQLVDDPDLHTFKFLHIGQWQPRKSTLEICQSFLKAFPDNPKVRFSQLILCFRVMNTSPLKKG